MNSISAEIRSPQAKAKNLRKAGLVPCCIFGPRLQKSISVQITQDEAKKLLREKHKGSKLEIGVGGEKTTVLIRDISRDPVKDEIEHISFQALVADKKVNTVARVVLLNRDKVSGYVSQALFEIPYAALPADLVDTVTVDLADRKAGCRCTVKDLAIAKNDRIELLLDKDSLVLSIVAKRIPSRNTG